MALFRRKILRCTSSRYTATMQLHIVTMVEFHKSGSFNPLLWNCAACAARINCKAVYSVSIIIAKSAKKSKMLCRK